eukprot:jgi/Bigna1/72169/fgenesh1_pg.18_\
MPPARSSVISSPTTNKLAILASPAVSGSRGHFMRGFRQQDIPWRSVYGLDRRAGITRVSAEFQRTSGDKYDYDLFVIGAGSGGVRASRMSAGYGARVALADDLAVGLGGTCVNVGCVPKKLFSYGSEITQDVQDAKGFGWDFPTPSLTWPRLIENKDTEINRLNGIYERMLSNAGVDLKKGRGVLKGPHTVEVNGEEYTAEKILVAVGGWPSIPDIEGKEHLKTSNDIFFVKEAPQKPVIIGSGYIAVEFAGILHGYKADTHLVIRRDSILRGFDDDTAKYLLEAYEKNGIHVHKNTEVVKVEKRGEADYLCTLKDGSTIESDFVIAAIGRHPKTVKLGLEDVGVDLDKNGGISVKKDGQTSIPSIYAIGDCTATLQLTPVALAEGHCFADTHFGNNPRLPDLEDVATAVFSHPNLGTVGLSEERALEKYGKIKVFKSEFRPLKHTVSGSQERSMMKIVVDSATDRVVGMHMVGAHAGEIMQGFSAAIKMGITKKVLDSTIGIHPTSAEEFVTMRSISYEKSKEESKDPQMKLLIRRVVATDFTLLRQRYMRSYSHGAHVVVHISPDLSIRYDVVCSLT